MRRQIEGCRARHERLGLPQKYLDGLDEFVRDAATLIPLRCAAGHPDRRIHSGEFSAEPRNRRLAAVGTDRLRRRVDRMARIRPARPERLHDRGNAAPRPKPFRRVRIFAGGYDADTEATADGAAAAASRQRSDPAHLHRGLAAEGRRPVRIGAIALAELIRLDCVSGEGSGAFDPTESRRVQRTNSNFKQHHLPTLVIPREGGASSTPRPLGSIMDVSGILVHPPSRVMTIGDETQLRDLAAGLREVRS